MHGKGTKSERGALEHLAAVEECGCVHGVVEFWRVGIFMQTLVGVDEGPGARVAEG
jgi:hypothetical protein